MNFRGSIHGLSEYGQPDIAGIMIGINDNRQGQLNPDPGVNPGRGSNVSEFTRTLGDEVLKPAIAAGVRPYIVSVSVIGEKREGTNTKVGKSGDKELDAFVVAQKSVAAELNLPVCGCAPRLPRLCRKEQLP